MHYIITRDYVKEFRALEIIRRIKTWRTPGDFLATRI